MKAADLDVIGQAKVRPGLRTIICPATHGRTRLDPHRDSFAPLSPLHSTASASRAIRARRVSPLRRIRPKLFHKGDCNEGDSSMRGSRGEPPQCLRGRGAASHRNRARESARPRVQPYRAALRRRSRRRRQQHRLRRRGRSWPGAVRCLGYTGAVTRVDTTGSTPPKRVVRNLPSLAVDPGVGAAEGVFDVAFGPFGQMFILAGFGGDPAARAGPRQGGQVLRHRALGDAVRLAGASRRHLGA